MEINNVYRDYIPVSELSKVGRNTVRTKESSEAICRTITAGNTHKVACAVAGIHVSTFYRWMEDDSEFSDAVKKAQAESERYHVSKINKDGSWQSSAWMLERRNHDEWGKKDQLKLSGDQKNPLFFKWSDND